MRVLVCGDRWWIDRDLIRGVLISLIAPPIIIEGEAQGADTIAREIAEEEGFTVIPFPARWRDFGRRAGPLRNRQMLAEGKPDLVIAFHDQLEASKGTKNMIDQALKAGACPSGSTPTRASAPSLDISVIFVNNSIRAKCKECHE